MKKIDISKFNIPKIDIPDNNIILIIALFSFFEPEFFKPYSFIHFGFNILRVVTFSWITLYYMVNRVKPSKFTMAVMIYYLILLISTIFNRGAVISLISNSIPIIGFILLIEVLLIKDTIGTLGNLTFIYSLLIYVNLIFLYIFPYGYNNYYTNRGTFVINHFLGNRNSFAPILIPGIIVAVLYSTLKHNKLSDGTIFLILMSGLTLYKAKSATALVGLALIIGYLIVFYKREKLNKIITGKRAGIAYIIIYFGIVILRQQKLFAFLIRGILGKSLTFSTRTRIWDRAMEMIWPKFILGHGNLNSSRYVVFPDGRSFSPHNFYLHLFFIGGVVLALWFTYMVAKTLLHLDEEKSNISKFMVFSIFTIFLMMMMEVYPLIPIFLLLGLATHIKDMNLQYSQEFMQPKVSKRKKKKKRR